MAFRIHRELGLAAGVVIAGGLVASACRSESGTRSATAEASAPSSTSTLAVASASAPAPSPASAPAPVPAPSRASWDLRDADVDATTEAVDADVAHATTIRARRASIEGALGAAAVDLAVRRAFPRLRLCYEHAGSTARAEVATRIVIARDGRVIDAHDVPLVDATTTPLGACVVRVFASLVFPEPASGVVTVVYPLSFESATSVPAPAP